MCSAIDAEALASLNHAIWTFILQNCELTSFYKVNLLRYFIKATQKWWYSEAGQIRDGMDKEQR
jgi:hypothetical protein